MKSTVVFLVVFVTGASAAVRTLKFKNSCGEKVRVGFTAGAPQRKGCQPRENCPITCNNSPTECPTGTFCGNTKSKQCFYNPFMPLNHYDLGPGDNTYFNISIADGAQFSGLIYGSTGCDTYSHACETAICGDKVCPPEVGAVGPMTIAEFAFDTKGADFYDISFKGGVNVPMSMTPIGGTPVAGDPYSCTAAGGVIPTNLLPGCTFGYNSFVNGADHATDLIFVATQDPDCTDDGVCRIAGGDCTSNSQCTTPGEVCGLAAGRDPTGKPTTAMHKVCGKPVGLWNAEQVCVYSNGAFGAPYNCKAPLNYGTNWDLYGCSGNYKYTGYDITSPPDKTCGCYDWEGIHSSDTCKQRNSEWLTVALPWLKVLKGACPTAYTYAYDDKTATFTCQGEQFLTHEIEFCPGGKTLHKI